MKTNEIRKKFLEYFGTKQHAVLESDSLVPKNDPTVLFTTAGMQQFKRQFLGHIDDFTRAATSQKCMRTDDLDEVGVTDFHHTFFEMLGNFSFGDYFKKEAITWAWEFLTQELQINPERLWVSVYEEDVEAESIWKNDIKIPEEKIFRLGGKSNFWPSNAKENGPNGPCGPCSEIFYDYDPERGTCPKDPDDEMGRFSEVWNLVFTQYNRKDGGELEPLPGKNIDTGMGLERLAAVLQGKKNNFETDIFIPILKAVDDNITLETKNQKRNERYVIADHLRGICFGINDGVIPSNEGRGYVIKKLIIDISDITIRNGNKKPVIHKLVPSLIEAMGEAYPDLVSKAADIAETIRSIENIYMKVRQKRMPELKTELSTITNQSATPVETIIYDAAVLCFKYRDTFGLTPDAITEVLSQIPFFTQDRTDQLYKIYQEEMNKQQEQSRASSKMSGDVFASTELELDVPKTEFVGYKEAATSSILLNLFSGSNPIPEAKTGDEIRFVLDKTPFYAESGGQVGDTGLVTLGDSSVRVLDTQKMDDIFVHFGRVERGSFKIQDNVNAKIDVDRRLSIMRNHTVTHLMQAALREVLGTHIKQQGSLVAEDRLRFDFSHPKAITAKELEKIEDMVNVFIRACDQVDTEYLPLDEARKSGALAFFAEKYGKTVRVVTIGKYSKEFCGGTHLGSTGQIGVFKIVSESAIAQGIRRIEAKSGIGALEQIKQQEQQLNNIAKTFKVPVEEVVNKVSAQAQKMKQMEKNYETLKFDAIKKTIVGELENTQQFQEIRIYKNIYENTDMAMLRKISDFIKQKLPTSIIILGAKSESGASVLIASSDTAVKQGYKANELIKHVADKIEGRGGGRPQLAQAGGKNTSNIEDAINSLNDMLLQGKVQ